jgi:hypothetical protein
VWDKRGTALREAEALYRSRTWTEDQAERRSVLSVAHESTNDDLRRDTEMLKRYRFGSVLVELDDDARDNALFMPPTSEDV